MMKRTYTVFCNLCYSWQRTKLSRKDANAEAISHMNMYGHDVAINEEYKCTHSERPGRAGGQNKEGD